jgi:hypothetical protein
MIKTTAFFYLIGVVSAAVFDIGHDHAHSCTGKVRVCHDGESPTDANGEPVCNENKMNRPTVIIDAQNWPTTLQNAWMMQVIMQEYIQIPVELNDQRGPEGSSADFYNGTGSLHGVGWNGPAYAFDALREGNANFTCSNGRSCAHILTEIWSGRMADLNRGVLVDRDMAKAGALGVFGRFSWFIQKWVADAYGGFTYRELNTPAITTQFGKPMTWTEHCAEQAATLTTVQYATTVCKFWADSTSEEWKTAVATTERHGFMVSKSTFTAANVTAAIAAGVTDIPADPTTHVWAGRLKPYASGKAHIMEAPCGWTTYFPLQMPTVNAEAVQYSYGQMLSLWEVMAYNLNLVDRTQPQANWPSDPHWYPIIGWWWTPDSMPIKYQYAGEQYKLESVYLEPWNGKCEKARQEVFVPRYKTGTAAGYTAICKNGAYDETLNPNWRTECGQACVDASCDYPADGLQIATAASLATTVPDAMKMLGKFNIDTSVQLGWIGTDDFNSTWQPAKTTATTAVAGMRSRDIICQYIRENENLITAWLPDTHVFTGCRVSSTDPVCSGNGKCMTPADASKPGYCQCDAGYNGDQCESTDTAFLPALIFTSKVLADDNNRFFKWDAIKDEQCCVLTADESCTADGRMQPCPTTIEAYVGKTGIGRNSGETGIAGYRISVKTRASTIVKVFQPSSGLSALGIALGAVGVVISVVFMGWTMALKNKPVILFSQPKFLLTVLVGAVLEFISMMMLSNGYMSSELCYASAWAGHLGFAIAFSALFAKTWRLNKLFNNKKLRKMRITNKDVFMIVALITFVSLLTLLVWTIMGAADAKYLQQSYGTIYETTQFDVYVGCNSEEGAIPIFILLGFEGLLLLYSAMMAYNARNIDVSFGESKHIAIVIYNIFIIGIVAVVISFVGPGSIDPDGLFVAQVVCQFAGTVMTICVLFLPKLLNPNQAEGNTTSGTGGTAGTTPTTDSSASPSSADRGIGKSGSSAVMVSPKPGQSAA